MKPIFGKSFSISLRVFFAVVFSFILMLIDNRLEPSSYIKNILNNMVAPIQHIANIPRNISYQVSTYFSFHDTLLKQNANLQKDLLYLKSNLTLLEHYEKENQRLRQLLNSPFVREEKKLVAQVMAVNSSPYRHQVMINKGSLDGVYVGQPVINERGVVGQVTYVAAYNARVLLIIDAQNAIPVQVVRNDIRVLASGDGKINQIGLDYIQTSADVEIGDLLITSGLAGIYPEGYPVAHITTVDNNSGEEFMLVKAEPVVDFSRLRYLLLVWPTPKDEKIKY